MQEWHKSRSFAEALGFAWSGIKEVYVGEKNLRWQTWAFFLVLAVGIALGLPASHLAIVILASALVFSLELVNTALEAIEDLVWPEYREAIRRSKDIAAGAVLVAGLAAAAVGLLIFLPPLAKFILLVY